ncbi:MAG: hypothetical protein K1X85_08455 [Ignavibacteria bacterium]|nr:hypothetical protein [Ignavibacteria bacterium]
MKKRNLITALAFAVLCLLQSCIELKQVTHINKDGSGIVNIHYSTRISNLSMGDEMGNFAFSETKARNYLTSAGTDVRELKIETRNDDSTIHVTAVMNFSDFNKLNDAKTFSKFRTLWEKAGDEFVFMYALDKDSVAGINFSKGTNELNYEFNFPGEVVSGNGKSEGNKAVWKIQSSGISDGFNLQARVKAGSVLSELLRLEVLVALILLALALFTFRNIRRSNEKKTAP